MARIRSCKPELRRSLTVAQWPREVRYAWVLLWGYLDDHGRGLDHLSLITSDLFPLDRDVTEKKMDEWLSLMARTQGDDGETPLCRYEVGGRKYLHAPKWRGSQRVSHPQVSKVPACPWHDEDGNRTGSGTVPDTNGSDSSPTSLAPLSGEIPESVRPSRTPEGQGVKGSREQGATSGPPSGGGSFDAWWFAYPHKVGKDEARRAYAKALKRSTAPELLAGAERYRDDPTRDPGYTANPATWLNQGRWQDEAPARPAPRRSFAQERAELDLDPHDEWKRNA